MFELNDNTRWILGRPSFWCGSVARVLRRLGHEINERAEDEQAAVIHWMLGLYFDHGDKWREVAHLILSRVKEAVEVEQEETS